MARRKPQVLEQLAKQTGMIISKEDGWQVYYLGFSANGWTEEALEAAQAGLPPSNKQDWDVIGVRLLNLEQVDADLVRWPSMPVN